VTEAFTLTPMAAEKVAENLTEKSLPDHGLASVCRGGGRVLGCSTGMAFEAEAREMDTIHLRLHHGHEGVRPMIRVSLEYLVWSRRLIRGRLDGRGPRNRYPNAVPRAAAAHRSAPRAAARRQPAARVAAATNHSPTLEAAWTLQGFCFTPQCEGYGLRTACYNGDMAKYFTLDEANRVLPTVRALVKQIMQARAVIIQAQPETLAGAGKIHRETAAAKGRANSCRNSGGSRAAWPACKRWAAS